MSGDDFDLAAWADRVGMAPIGPDRHDVVTLSDMDVTVHLARAARAYAVQAGDRGSRRRTYASFGTEADARRFLVTLLGDWLRLRQRLPRISASAAAPGVSLTQDPEGVRLVWDDRWGTFEDRDRAATFSWVRATPLADIAASYADPGGRPCFSG